MSSGVAIGLFVGGIVLAIMFHEAGHFVTARWFGMRADRFFLGFGPTLWSFRPGETEYGIKLLPLGGFVRIKGMSPNDQRLRPVADAVFDPEALAAERRRVAAETGADLLDVPAITDSAWRRLDAQLAVRGTPKAVRRRIVTRTRNTVGDGATPAQARSVLHQVVVTEVTDTERVGDLHHRLVHGDAGRFFPDRPAWQRAIVLVAGSAMHLIIAVVLLFGGFLLVPQPTGEVLPVVSEVVTGSPADASGLAVGDRIVAVAGEATDDFTVVRDTIRGRAGDPTTLLVERDGAEVTVTLTPERTLDPETGQYIGVAGFVPALEEVRLPFGDALYQTFVGPGSITALTLASVEGLGRVFGPEGIGQLFAQLAGGAERELDGAISVVGAVPLTAAGTEQFGAMFLIGMLASINVFVGVFNLLPLPPLDGGHLAVLAVERSVNAVRRHRGQPADYTVDPRAVAAVALPVIAVLGTVMFALLWLDITNPIQLPTP